MLPSEWETWHIPLIPELCPHNLLQYFVDCNDCGWCLMVASCDFKCAFPNLENVNWEISWKGIMLETTEIAWFYIVN